MTGVESGAVPRFTERVRVEWATEVRERDMVRRERRRRGRRKGEARSVFMGFGVVVKNSLRHFLRNPHAHSIAVSNGTRKTGNESRGPHHPHHPELQLLII